MYSGDYKLIGSELSFFTRKLEAPLRFQKIPWHYLFKTEERRPSCRRPLPLATRPLSLLRTQITLRW